LEYLIERVKVAVVPGRVLVQKGYIRLSYATSLENIKEAVERIFKSLD
jgi:Aspartate/tyrosine/aromatic aminotransferase